MATRWYIPALLLLAACGSSGGLAPDGGPGLDGGVVQDGGPSFDGGPAVDGGPVFDGGLTLDGGTIDGGAFDGGATCDPACPCADRGPADFSRANTGAASPASTADQKEALVRANRWRTAAGLPAVDIDVDIEEAATAHAAFLATNPEASCWPDSAHIEVEPGCGGFTGRSAGPRATTAGYSWRLVTEVINWESTVAGAVDTWIWTVYHRRSFFNWSLVDTGFARRWGPRKDHDAYHNVMSFGTPRTAGGTAPSGPVVFPVPGQTGVQRFFDGDRESPTPPAPPAGWPSGTVVSVHFPSSTWSVTKHELFRSSGQTCTPVSHTFITRDNDPALADRDADEVFLYAHQPLVAATEYVVRVEGTADGQAFTRTWAFTTE